MAKMSLTQQRFRSFLQGLFFEILIFFVYFVKLRSLLTKKSLKYEFYTWFSNLGKMIES